MPSPTPANQLDPLELDAWRGLLKTHRDVVARLDSELEREHGIPLGSYEVLIFLNDAPENRLRMGELAHALLLSRSGLTRMVDRLERQGLVARERCDSDARGFFAVITPAGKDLLAKVRPAHLAGVRRNFLERLDREDMEALTRAWRKVAGDAA